ncbi:ABC transporter permease subunit [Kitasatospora sp. NPDC049258]|uniref:ABC transporter permease n=1 Tax=Kitasatospora sp. NPDC049258 TaxID=3155394 RepID=UPI00343037FE
MTTVDTARPAAGPTARRRFAPTGIWWLMWRQQRLLILIALAAVVTAAVVFPILRAAMTGYIDSHHIAGCAAISLDPACQSDGVQRAVDDFRGRYAPILQGVGYLLLMLPAAAGVMVGGPLFSREYEQGTWRLVLGQSVSRTRWLAAKLATVGAVALLGSAALMGLYRWMWLPSADFVSGVAWCSSAFIVSGGPVLVATTLLALAVGATAGSVTRRVVPAMGITFGVVVLLQIALASVRPYLVPWQTRFGSRSELPNDVWSFGQGFLTPDGKRLPYDVCVDSDRYTSCLAGTDGAREYAEVHSAADYWPLQGVESALCLVLTAALVVLLFRRDRRAD